MTNKYITSPESLVTSKEQTENAFINVVKEKQKNLDNVCIEVKKVRCALDKIKTVNELKKCKELRQVILMAAGLSEKAINLLSTDSKDKIFNDFIATLSESEFREEILNRYLIVKGDSFGGSIRNKIGIRGEILLVFSVLKVLKEKSIDFDILEKKSKGWTKNTYSNIENIVAIHWEVENQHRLLLLRRTIPLISKNVDICLCNSSISEYETANILEDIDKMLMLGEIKSGAAPAGADEHWKTANTALNRIREGYQKHKKCPKTSFLANSITLHMAKEIYSQLNSGVLSNAANLNNQNQLKEYCNWLISL